MDTLNRIIGLMDKEELRFFKLYANRAQKGEERKDLALFDYIRRAGERFNERKILKKLYGTKNKNVYYRLKNRLFNEVNKSLVMQHCDDDETTLVHHNLVLARLFRNKQQHEVALHFVRKAEKKAESLGRLELLDMVFGEYIELSYHLLNINPEEYIEKRNENRQTLNQLREIDNIIAAVNYRIRISGNISGTDNSILDLLQKTVDEFSQDPELRANPQFRFRMYHAVAKTLIQRHDYPALENYLLATYAEFTSEKLFHRGNHDTHLQMLTYLINALFANEKYETSLEYIGKLMEQMMAYNKLLFDKYLFFYYNTQANIYSHDNLPKAIEILEELLRHKIIKQLPIYEMYTYANLALFQFNSGKPRAAIQKLVKLNLLDTFRGADEAFKFKVAVFELLVRFDLDDFEVLEYKLNQYRKTFEEQFSHPDFIRQRTVVDFVEKMNAGPDWRKNKALRSEIEAFIETDRGDDTDIVVYREWLAERLG